MINIDNPRNYKWIINNGCSYGQLLTSTIEQERFFYDLHKFESKCKSVNPHRYLSMDNDVVFIDLYLPGAGAIWQSETTIYHVNKLLSLGVPANQIYVVIEWSDLERHMVHPSHLYEIENINVGYNNLQPIAIFNNKKLKKLNTDITQSNQYCKRMYSISHDCLLGGKLNDTYFFQVKGGNCTETGDSQLSFFLKNERKIVEEQSIEFFVQQYFNYIIKTQNFLKYNRINYKFTSMFSFLQGWYKDGVLKKHIVLNNDPSHISPYSEDGDIIVNENPPTDYIRNNIRTMFPQFQFLFDQIDYNQFWFYDSKKFKFGGIDEWAIDTLGEVGYYDTNRNYLTDNIQKFRNHPNPLMYILLWNKICDNCEFVTVKENYLDELTTKYWEDYNSDKSTKHGVSISKKYLDLEIEKYNNSL